MKTSSNFVEKKPKIANKTIGGNLFIMSDYF
jgi:hypothetical protein